jgi:predicted esterase
MFNGTNEIADEFYDRTRAQDFVDAGFVVVAPQDVGHGTVWPVWDAMRESGDENRSGPDLDFFDSLVACTRSHIGIDKKRIFAAGHSAGGIMTNFVLQRRSNLLAGGIIASGILSLTAPDPGEPLDDMAVFVTWGGDNDAVRGLEGLPEFNFYEQAVLASRYYQEEDAVKQVWCRGDELGHAWLDGGNAMMIDFLLSHPKGKSADWTFSPPGESENHSCGETALAYVPLEQVSCPLSETSGCQDYCDFIGDCVVENGTVQPVLAPQLESLGFGGDNEVTDCRSCLDLCEEDAAEGGDVDADVLSCLSESAEAAVCGPGVEGAMPFIDGFNLCCTGQDESEVCETLCTEILTNNVAKGFFQEGCAAWASE